MEQIAIDNKQLMFSEDTIIYLQEAFSVFDKTLINIKYSESVYFDIKLSYSYDNVIWSNPLSIEEFENPDNNTLKVYVAIYLVKKQLETQEASELKIDKNTVDLQQQIIIDSITYDDLLLEDFKIKSLYSIISRYPKWNFYDNQEQTIKRWLSNCESVTESYGHVVIYFKTSPLETLHTFSTHVIKNVIDIKKLKIMIPNNELPQDRQTFTDWDMMLQDDFSIHIVKSIFEQAFGENTFPQENDYLYLPIINKLFKVSSMQPKNGFMGRIGWWETYLSKYEDNECVVLSDAIKESLKPTFNDDIDIDDDMLAGIEMLEELPKPENLKNILEGVEDMKTSTILSSEIIYKKTIEEKKTVTQNFTNKLEDSTHYVSLKETEKMRDFIDNRLKIVSINPDENSFPITMYDCSVIEKRKIGLSYNLSDFNTKNKYPLNFETLLLEFDYIMTNRFNGEIIDLVNDDLPLFTVESNQKKLNFICNQNKFLVDYNFLVNEFYRIEISIKNSIKQIGISIFKLVDKQKILDYQNLYIYKDCEITTISNIWLYGGNYFIGNILLKLNDNKILDDKCNPVLIMNKFQ